MFNKVICVIRIDQTDYQLIHDEKATGLLDYVKVFYLKKILNQYGEITTYRLYQRKNGRQECSCPDHFYRKRCCKHLQALRQLGILESRMQE